MISNGVNILLFKIEISGNAAAGWFQNRIFPMVHEQSWRSDRIGSMFIHQSFQFFSLFFFYLIPSYQTWSTFTTVQSLVYFDPQHFHNKLHSAHKSINLSLNNAFVYFFCRKFSLLEPAFPIFSWKKKFLHFCFFVCSLFPLTVIEFAIF